MYRQSPWIKLRCAMVTRAQGQKVEGSRKLQRTGHKLSVPQHLTLGGRLCQQVGSKSPWFEPQLNMEFAGSPWVVVSFPTIQKC